MVGFSQFESVVRIRIVGRFARRPDFVYQSRTGQITHDVCVDFFPPREPYPVPYFRIDRESDITKKNIVSVTTYRSLLYREAFSVQVAIYPHGLRNVDD
jgi:hypothetical protein